MRNHGGKLHLRKDIGDQDTRKGNQNRTADKILQKLNVTILFVLVFSTHIAQKNKDNSAHQYPWEPRRHHYSVRVRKTHPLQPRILCKHLGQFLIVL